MGGLAAVVVVVVLEKAERPGDLRDCRSSNGIDCMTRDKGHGGWIAFSLEIVGFVCLEERTGGKRKNKVGWAREYSRQS